MIELEQENKKIDTKYIWETIDIIPLLPLLVVNHRQPIIQMSKVMVYIYTTDEKLINLQLIIQLNP